MSEIFSLKKKAGKTSFSLSDNVFDHFAESMGIGFIMMNDENRMIVRKAIYKVMNNSIEESTISKEKYTSSVLEIFVLNQAKYFFLKVDNPEDFKLEMEQDGVIKI